MRPQQPIELRDFFDDVWLLIPRKATAAVDIDFFAREPFHSAGNPEAAADARERTQAIAQQRPVATARRKPIIVVRFAVMDIEPHTPALLQRVFQITRDFGS